MRRGIGVVAALLAAAGVVGPIGGAHATASPFTFGGVIEGSYGPTWSHDDRARMIEWMAGHGLTTYIHAPKFDAYQRAHWRDPYPAADMADFASEIALASGLGVGWVPNVSPGLPLIPSAPDAAVPDVNAPDHGLPSVDICFSCPDDIAALEAKLDPFFAAGARTLMISFDDVQKHSSHPEDAAAYGTDDAAYGAMTRDLLNTVQHHFQAAAGSTPFHLVTVLADYSGTADTAYLQGVRAGNGIDPEVTVLWTGNTVVSATIATHDAAAYAGWVGHDRVGIWDNYPANDYTGNIFGTPMRVFMGPYDGRAADLANAVSGIVVNVMNQAEANVVPLGTVARYLADPATYDPESAWTQSLSDLGGVDATDAVRAFAENSRSSALNPSESPPFTQHRDALLAALDAGPFWPDAADALVAELDRIGAAPSTIRAALPKFATAVNPFLDRLDHEALTARIAADLLEHQRPSLDVDVTPQPDGSFALSGRAAPPDASAVAIKEAALAASEAQDVADPHQVFGTRAGVGLDDPVFTGRLILNENCVDAFVLAAQQRTAGWLPTAPSAMSSVSLTIDGQPIVLGPAGKFGFTVAPGSHSIVATDGAGGTTGRVITTS